MKHGKKIGGKRLAQSVNHGGCVECQTTCQSACKISCTAGNQKYENSKNK